MKKLVFIAFILFTLGCIAGFLFYFERNLVVVKFDDRFSISRINYFEKKRLLNKEDDIIRLRGVIKGMIKDKNIEFFRFSFLGLKKIAEGKVFLIAGPFYDETDKFETLIQLKDVKTKE